MRIISKKLRNLARSESGQGLSEYLILVVLIAVTSIAAVQSLGGLIKKKLQVVRNQINSEVVFDR